MLGFLQSCITQWASGGMQTVVLCFEGAIILYPLFRTDKLDQITSTQINQLLREQSDQSQQCKFIDDYS